MNVPKVTDFAEMCVEYGAHGITVHPRPDQRHATYRDVYELAEFCQSHPDVEFNVEGYPTADFLKVVNAAQPDQCTLVPDAPDQVTSDHGWNTQSENHFLRPILTDLNEHGIRTSIFLDPDVSMIPSAAETGANRIELYTEEYARSFNRKNHDEVLNKYLQSATLAQEYGLGVNAGHDLNQVNLGEFLTIPNILEVSIGHALTVEALLSGFKNTVSAYVSIVEHSPSGE